MSKPKESKNGKKSVSVTVIPATLALHTHKPVNGSVKKKVAGYARVSTDSDEQYTSYEAQLDYYTEYIKKNPAWEFVDVYTDEGISGTNTKNREGFNRMISDALSGKIDLIVTKSISRFARNTVDSLTTVRKLKEKGVEVFFEKENIYTLDSKGELIISIMSSIAQEESRSLSENVTWGVRKRFADGQVKLPYSKFLGYKKGKNGRPAIVKKEAVIVRRIYELYLLGNTFYTISKILTDEHVPTPGGQEQWSRATIESILTNEKYRGSALLQKKYIEDYLTKKEKVNNGEVPKYYVEKSHPAIIEPEVWDFVQIEMERRKGIGGHYSSNGIFATRIICGVCGSFYRQRSWTTRKAVVRIVWMCNKKYRSDEGCDSPIVTEPELKCCFVEAVNDLIDQRKEILAECQIEYEVCMSGPRKKMRPEDKARAIVLTEFMNNLEELDQSIPEFSEWLWATLIETVIIGEDGRKIFIFKNGTEIIK